MQMSAAKRSSQDAYDVIRLTRAARTVDDVARLVQVQKKRSRLFIYFLRSVAYDPEGYEG